MSLLIVLAGILLLILLIVKKLNPMLALIIVSLITGLLLGMPISRVIASMNKGIGDTLASIVMVIAMGAMIGKLAEESGAARKIVQVLVRQFGIRHIQWAILFTSILAGIPLFYNAGFVVLFPLVFAIAASTGLPLLYVGIPMAASLSVTHGFLPPHPGPVTLTGLFHADLGTTLLYGMAITIPVAVIAGIFYPRLIIRRTLNETSVKTIESIEEKNLPSAWSSFLIVLAPVIFIMTGTIGSYFFNAPALQPIFIFLQEPTYAMLLSLALTMMLVHQPISRSMEACVEGVKGIAMIILIIAAGGAFKQVLVESNVGTLIREQASLLNLSPLFMGWLVAAIFRVSLGSASVAAIAAAGIVAPFLKAGVSPELMVLSVGAGSLMCSHVNDTGFWMFKEYFGLTLKQTFLTWTLMESIISVLGLGGVLLLNYL